MLSKKPHYLANGCIAAALFGLGAIALLSQSSQANNLLLFLLLATLTQVLAVIAFFYTKKNPHVLSAKKGLLLGCVVSAIGLMGQPIFEDDYFRYLWDGYYFYTHGTPYGAAPESFFTDPEIPERLQTILGYINHPSLPTIYGPTLQYSFLLAFIIDPGNVWLLQLCYALANLIIIAICLQLAPPHYVLLYILSPLVFKETLLTAHPDALGVALLLAACWASYRAYPMATGCLLALSIGAKVFALLLLPFLLLRQPIKVLSGLLLTLVALYLPLASQGASDLMGLSHMASDWEFNSALWGLSRAFLDIEQTRLLMAAILLLVLGSYGGYFYYRQQQPYQKQEQTPEQGLKCIPRGDIIFGSFLLCAPVINPWYMLWLLPFAVIYPSLSVWFASFIVLLAYLVPIYLPTLHLAGNYDQPLIIRWLEFGLLAGVLVIEGVWRKRRVIK